MVRWYLTVEDDERIVRQGERIVRQDEATNVGDALFAARSALDEIREPDSKELMIFGSPKYRLVVTDEQNQELCSLTLE